MAINKEAKRKVTEDWLNAFPQLTAYSQDKLYKIIGPLIIGLELVKLPRTDDYRPHFVMYPLWKKDVKANLSFPILLKEYVNKKGFQYDIPYTMHNDFFADAVNSVRRQTLLSFDEEISLHKIFYAIDEYSKTPPLSAAPNSYLQAALLESKLQIALFVSKSEAQNVLEQINTKTWDANHFKACGININDWLHTVKEIVNNRDELLTQIAENKLDKKIAQLKMFDIEG